MTVYWRLPRTPAPFFSDGLKHAHYSAVSRGAVSAYNPTLILYLLPDPLAAILSHFRRGWPGSQFCKLRGLDDADAALAGVPGLRAALAPATKGPNGSVPLEPFAALAAAAGEDFFGFEAHAASWLSAPELGYTVWFATLADVVERQDVLAALLGLEAPTQGRPLFRLPLRNRTSGARSGGRLPSALAELYEGVKRRLEERFRGRCAAPLPEVLRSGGLAPNASAASSLTTLEPSGTRLCAGKLPILLDSAPVNASLARLYAPLWASRSALIFSWKAYISGAAQGGPCRELLRLPPRKKAASVAQARAAGSLRRKHAAGRGRA